MSVSWKIKFLYFYSLFGLCTKLLFRINADVLIYYVADKWLILDRIG